MDCTCTGHLNHPGKVHCVSWNPKPYDGADDMLASCGDENTTVWSKKDSDWAGTPVLTEPNCCFRSCSWHPFGTILAVGGTDSKVTILEYDKKIGAMTQINTFRAERDDEITSLAWNYWGSILLCCTLNGSINLIIKSGDKYKMLYLTPGPMRLKNASMSCARWSRNIRNRNLFAVAGYTSIMFFQFQVKDKAPQINLVHAIDSRDKSYHKGGVVNIAFSSDHKLVSAGADKTLKVWSLEESHKRASSDVETLQLSHRIVQSLNEHHTSVLSTDWSTFLEPDKGLIASGCDQKTLYIYRYHKEGEKETWVTVVKMLQAHKGAINHLAWHYMDPQKLASASSDGSVKIWNLTNTIEEASSSRDNHQLSRNQQ